MTYVARAEAWRKEDIARQELLRMEQKEKEEERQKRTAEQERAKAIPKMKSMEEDAGTKEYLNIFELHMQQKHNPETPGPLTSYHC